MYVLLDILFPKYIKTQHRCLALTLNIVLRNAGTVAFCDA